MTNVYFINKSFQHYIEYAYLWTTYIVYNVVQMCMPAKSISSRPTVHSIGAILAIIFFYYNF